MGTGRVVWACLAPSPVSRRVGLGTDAIGETRRGAAAGRLSASEDKKLLAVSVIQCGRFYPVPYGVTGHTSHDASVERSGPRRARRNLNTPVALARLNLDGRRG